MAHVKLYEEFGKQIVIFPGRFQPFHNGHIQAFRTAHRLFNLPVLPLQIVSKTEESPFPLSLLSKVNAAVGEEFSFIEKPVIFPQGIRTVIPQMVKLLREHGYDPVALACGEDRYKDYLRQVEYLLSDRSDVPTSSFSLRVVDERIDSAVSGTSVRKAIADRDRASFESKVPKSVKKFYPEFTKFL